MQDARYGGLPNEPRRATHDEAPARKYIIQQQAEAVAEDEARARASSGRGGAYARTPEMMAAELDTFVSDGGAAAGGGSRQAAAGQRRAPVGGLGRGRSRGAVAESSDDWL